MSAHMCACMRAPVFERGDRYVVDMGMGMGMGMGISSFPHYALMCKGYYVFFFL